MGEKVKALLKSRRFWTAIGSVVVLFCMTPWAFLKKRLTQLQQLALVGS